MYDVPFVACSKSDTELKNIQKVDYLVSYSNAMKAGGYIYAYDKKGNEISKIEVDGQSIMSNAKDGEGTTSHQIEITIIMQLIRLVRCKKSVDRNNYKM